MRIFVSFLPSIRAGLGKRKDPFRHLRCKAIFFSRGTVNDPGNIIPLDSVSPWRTSGWQENSKMADDNVWTEKFHKMALDKEKALFQTGCHVLTSRWVKKQLGNQQ